MSYARNTPAGSALLALAGAWLCVSALGLGATASNQTRGVLILLADDAGFEMGAYRNKIVQTPNLDALAKRSVLFNNAFTSASSCSPSRAALLTGQPSHQNGMYGLHHSVHHFNTFDSTASLPRQLRVHGVYTGIIGKKHVGPVNVFQFDYEQTEEHHPINQVGRNITLIKLLTREFLARAAGRPFLLVVGFHDPHRCSKDQDTLGAFCERFGTGENNVTGRIPDWTPWFYQWDEIDPPYHVPETEAARRDLAAQYTAISRLDQGVGLVLQELATAKRTEDTLVAYTSDNGPPFPGGRTNLYEAGVRVPLLLSAPHAARTGVTTTATASLLDVTPTALHWFGLPHQQELDNDIWQDDDAPKSLLPILDKEPPVSQSDAVMFSQTHHEVTMYYPMRAVRTRHYKLIHNLNYGMPFPIDQDLFRSATFQDIVNRTRAGIPLPWYTTLAHYRTRPEWQLFDLRADPQETRNIHGAKELRDVEAMLAARLGRWLQRTADPWRCAPHRVLLDDCQPLDTFAKADHNY